MATSIKGATVVNTLGLLRELVGTERVHQLILECPPETRDILRHSIMAVEWVSADKWAAFLEGVRDQVTRGDELKFRKVLRAICKRDFSLQYRAYVQGATAAELIAKMPVVWRAYFNSGSLTTGPVERVNGANQTMVQLSDFACKSSVFSNFLHACLEQLLQMVGTEASTVESTAPVLRGVLWSSDHKVRWR
jgi:hypothetical protein